MKVLKRIGRVLLILILASILGLWITGNGHVLRGLRCTYLVGVSKPDIDDMNYFDLRKMPADQPEIWAMKDEYNLHPLSEQFLRVSDSLRTAAYLVFHQDSLLFEKYWKKNTDTTHFNSFSMAKSFTALLIGIAIDEGYIQGLDQPVGDFIPEYANGKDASLTIRHLLQMASGIPFGESYSSPFGFMAKAYYGRNMNELTLGYKVERDPGSLWAYEGGNTILLGMILKKATGRTVADYFFQKVWSCIGSEQPAYWNLDNYNGNEKTYTGFYATARDFARIGKLYAHKGVWENDTIVSPSFIEECLKPNGIPDENGEACSWYGLHWWIGQHEGSPYFSCRGLRGQYVVVLPEEKIMMVRIGHEQSKVRENHMPTDMAVYISEAKRMVKKEI